MKRLLAIELQILGEYRDIWLYKGRLHLWTRDGILHYLTFEKAFNEITRRYSLAVANLAQTLIFRNDWKVGEQFRNWMNVEGVASAVLEPFRHTTKVRVGLPLHLFTRSPSEAYSGIVLDTTFYADRIYIATTEGLLETYINNKRPDDYYELNQQTSDRAAAVTVRHSAINVSAEDKGLQFAPVRFSDSNSAPGFLRGNWRQVADYSLSTSFVRRNLLNYTKSAVPVLLKSKIKEVHSERSQYDDVNVIGYDDDPIDVSAIAYSAAATARKVTSAQPKKKALAPQGSDFQVLGNSGYHLLASWEDQVGVIDFFADRGKPIEARPSKKFYRNPVQVGDLNGLIQTYAISGGFITEYYDHLSLITAEGLYHLVDGECARVRTFDSSLRHKECVGIVQETTASAIGFLEADQEDNVFLFPLTPRDHDDSEDRKHQ